MRSCSRGFALLLAAVSILVASPAAGSPFGKSKAGQPRPPRRFLEKARETLRKFEVRRGRPITRQELRELAPPRRAAETPNPFGEAPSHAAHRPVGPPPERIRKRLEAQASRPKRNPPPGPRYKAVYRWTQHESERRRQAKEARKQLLRNAEGQPNRDDGRPDPVEGQRRDGAELVDPLPPDVAVRALLERAETKLGRPLTEQEFAVVSLEELEHVAERGTFPASVAAKVAKLPVTVATPTKQPTALPPRDADAATDAEREAAIVRIAEALRVEEAREEQARVSRDVGTPKPTPPVARPARTPSEPAPAKRDAPDPSTEGATKQAPSPIWTWILVASLLALVVVIRRR